MPERTANGLPRIVRLPLEWVVELQCAYSLENQKCRLFPDERMTCL